MRRVIELNAQRLSLKQDESLCKEPMELANFFIRLPLCGAKLETFDQCLNPSNILDLCRVACVLMWCLGNSA